MSSGPTIDFRSDTVTKPTPEMLEAMLQSDVGDDVYGEDPSINTLQVEAAELAGFEAALFTPTGSMANQIAIAAHTQRGQEVICTQGAHIYEYELGTMAAFSGVVPRFVAAPLGVPNPEDIRESIGRSPHKSQTGLIALENTHNVAGGTVVPLNILEAVREIASSENLPLHLDGARVFNACVALGVSLQEIAKYFDSFTICLSKGLGAPVGSLVLGKKEFIARCHRYRKMMGGGMRQAGFLAAAGSYALKHGPARLEADHRRAKILAETLLSAGHKVNMQSVQTNMVYAEIPDAAKKLFAWEQRGLRAGNLYGNTVRFVTHFQITDDDMALAQKIILAD